MENLGKSHFSVAGRYFSWYTFTYRILDFRSATNTTRVITKIHRPNQIKNLEQDAGSLPQDAFPLQKRFSY